MRRFFKVWPQYVIIYRSMIRTKIEYIKFRKVIICTTNLKNPVKKAVNL